MRTFRNNQKRIRNRGIQDRPFKRSNGFTRSNQEFGNRENGFRRMNNRNNGNVDKLILKYNELAREALSNGDKILSENYLQHSEHFSRILISQENSRNHSENNTQNNELSKVKVETENNVEMDNKEVEEVTTK